MERDAKRRHIDDDDAGGVKEEEPFGGLDVSADAAYISKDELPEPKIEPEVLPILKQAEEAQSALNKVRLGWGEAGRSVGSGSGGVGGGC